MTTKSSKRLHIILFSILLTMSFSVVAQSTSDPDIDRIKRATVFIYQARNQGNNLIITCVSTGTIVSYDGLILTNAHSTVRGTTCNGDTIIVAINIDLDEPPIPKYRADIAQVDEGLDIALLQITRELDGRLIAEGALPTLPFVEIGDSSAVTIDQNITIFGYTNIDNEPVDITRGTITAFIS